MSWRVLALALLAMGHTCVAPATEPAPATQKSLQTAAAELAEQFRVDWNTHDMDAMGRLMTADADFVNVIRSARNTNIR